MRAETRAWLDSKSVNTSVWPTQSPDVNITEYLAGMQDKTAKKLGWLQFIFRFVRAIQKKFLFYFLTKRLKNSIVVYLEGNKGRYNVQRDTH